MSNNDSMSSDDNRNSIQDNTIYELSEIPIIPEIPDRAQVKMKIPVPVLKEFYENTIRQYGNQIDFNDVVNMLLQRYNLKFNEERHAELLRFNNKEPRKDVFAKLYEIANVIESEYNPSEIHGQNIPMIVRRALGDLDERTLEKYVKCLIDYANSVNPHNSTHLNFERMKDAIRHKLDSL